MKFIPNYNYELIDKLTHKNNKLIIHHSESNYEVRKKWMSHILIGDMIYMKK